MSSFFRPEVAPMFEKPQKSRAEGGSAAGGVWGSANAGSASRLAGAALRQAEVVQNRRQFWSRSMTMTLVLAEM
eukprot:433002-Rhodomonas_salina.1